MMPGDKLLDGSVLRSTKCAGRQDLCVYTSPTVRYAGLKFYAEPQPFGGGWFGSIVLQCRQQPSNMKVQGETMGFAKSFGAQHRVCPHVPMSHVECISDVRNSIIPYGLLVRVWRKGT